MKFIAPEHWRPQGSIYLEPNAWQALRRVDSTIVIAGPGAGKTEFLAQKAAYLLETGLCPPSKKILAISFKTDASLNLADRVAQRCPQEFSSRFISMTFDAFTKNLVDRFRMALPEAYRPTKRYDVSFISLHQERQIINSFRGKYSNAVDLYKFTKQLQNMNQFIGGVRLGDPSLSWLEEEFLAFWLHLQIDCIDGVSKVSFLALNRLAEYITRTNDHVRRAIRETYPFIFIDEFQDTTFAQYDFLSSVFRASEAVVTVVGDYKQRIMGWAGARGDAFRQFDIDFSALRYPLLLNHRSSPQLVRIQHIFAQAIDYQITEVQTSRVSEISGDAAWICASRTVDHEASFLASWIANDMRSRALLPRDYSFLVRQTPENYEQDLSYYLAQYGLRLRNENMKIGKTTLQDLLAEELTNLFSNLLMLGIGNKSAKIWSQLSADIQKLRNTNQEDEKALRKIEHQLTTFITKLKHLMRQPITPENARQVFDQVIGFIDLNDLRQAYVRYSTGDLLEINLAALEEFFINCIDTQISWNNFLDEFLGINHIPLMTIHKSKGLEFDTIIFIGIDDNAWWSYKPNDAEGLSTFFVALSRAKQRAIFSYCEQRGPRNKVADFFNLLAVANVPEYQI